MHEDAIVLAGPQGDAGGAVDGQGEDEAIVVVGVFADEVDASRRAHDGGGQFAVFGDEALLDCVG